MRIWSIRYTVRSTDWGQLLSARLGVLAKMGLAKSNENGWIVRREFLQALKTMQQARDRQQMLPQYGILI